MVLVIGHRGVSSLEPENTIRSFLRAVSIGVDMIELDVHLTADDHLAVIHDDTVDRTTDGTGKVRSFTCKELKELDAGNGEGIPTLEEVLKEVSGRVKVNIELKGTGTASAVYERMEDLMAFGYSKVDLLLSSFSPIEMLELHDLSSENPRAVIIEGNPQGADEFAVEIGCGYVHPHHKYTESQFIDRCHGLGLKVNVWTIDDIDMMSRFVDMNVDGLITDDPGTALKVLDRRAW